MSEILDDNISQESTDGTFAGNLGLLTSNDKDNALEIKEDITQAELSEESTKLKAKLNWTDPIVWHDPSFNKGVIIKQIDTDVSDSFAANSPQTNHKIDAIYFPLIKINQRIINNNDIIYMKLYSDDVLPKLRLIIRDSNNSITNLNSAGVDTEIVIVITSPVNGIYKKIKLPFYIDDVFSDIGKSESRTYTYSCTMKLPIMKDKYPTSMNYPEKNQWPGCSMCKQPTQKKPNSWEMLHYIAQEAKLGFASTKQCKEISDRDWRNFNVYTTLEDCLIKEKEFAGTNETEAIFDWWVDFYGYLVMVNVPWVLNEDITTEHLAIYGVLGPQEGTDSSKSPNPQIALVNRTLSDTHNVASLTHNHNLMIRRYEILTNNDLYESGTCSTFNIFMPKGAGGQNGLDKFDVQIEEKSVSGIATERYLTQQTYIDSVDMSGTSKQKKKSIFNRYFQNKRAKRLCVELENFNLGLQRGTLVNVILTETNPQNKAAMMNNLQNLNAVTVSEEDPLQKYDSSPTYGEVSENAPTKEDFVKEQNIEVVNQGLSGLYYIDAITFEYNVEQEQRIYQKLYLIKKGVWGNYITPYGHYRIDHDTLDATPQITN